MAFPCSEYTVRDGHRQYANVLEVTVMSGVACDVFNLEVADDHTYVANGVVVHNCDLLAETDAYGYGPGMYPPDKWPVAPHPHCACSAGEVIMRPPSEWAQPKGPSRPLDIDPSDQRHTARWAERWTDRTRERYQQTFAAILAEADRFATLRAA